jgi:hypothetical protein
MRKQLTEKIKKREEIEKQMIVSAKDKVRMKKLCKMADEFDVMIHEIRNAIDMKKQGYQATKKGWRK